MAKSIKELLASDDPLSAEALDLLLHFREEDGYVDYKEDFHRDEEREWLEITKDVIAFANTNGGYLIFGVRNGTYELVGVDKDAESALGDANNVLQKINRHVEPQVSLVRCKCFESGGKTFLALLIPPSLGKTHLVSKDGSFKYPSGAEKIVLRQGTSYVRRSGANHLMDARDLDEIINRRLDYFRASLLDKIARVVEAPPSSELFVLSEDPTAEAHTKFIIVDSPDAIPVKGMSFTVAPATTEQEIASWIGMTTRDPQAIPPVGITWKWYRERYALKLEPNQKMHVAKYCLLNGTPAFFWLRTCKATDIKHALRDAISLRADPESVHQIVSVGAFLGKRFHKSLLFLLGDYAARLDKQSQVYPVDSPRALYRANQVTTRTHKFVPPGFMHPELLAELNEIAESALRSPGHQPELLDRWRAQTLDCFLYAEDDQYST